MANKTYKFVVISEEGQDHHWANVRGWFYKYAPQLDITVEEAWLIVQLSCFAFNHSGRTTQHATIDELATRIFSKAKDLDGRKRAVYRQLNKLQDKKMIVISSGQSEGQPNSYDIRPAIAKARRLATLDDWFWGGDTHVTPTPDTHVTPGVTPTSPLSESSPVAERATEGGIIVSNKVSKKEYVAPQKTAGNANSVEPENSPPTEETPKPKRKRGKDSNLSSAKKYRDKLDDVTQKKFDGVVYALMQSVHGQSKDAIDMSKQVHRNRMNNKTKVVYQLFVDGYDVNADTIQAWAVWYKHKYPGLADLPTAIDTTVKHIVAFIEENEKRMARIVKAQPKPEPKPTAEEKAAMQATIEEINASGGIWRHLNNQKVG